MSELSFGIIDNNADFQQKTNQLREAIDGLESDFATLYTNAGNSIKGIEQLVNDLRVQIDGTIMAPRHSGYPYPLSSSIRISRSVFPNLISNSS